MTILKPVTAAMKPACSGGKRQISVFERQKRANQLVLALVVVRRVPTLNFIPIDDSAPASDFKQFFIRRSALVPLIEKITQFSKRDRQKHTVD